MAAQMSSTTAGTRHQRGGCEATDGQAAAQPGAVSTSLHRRFQSGGVDADFRQERRRPWLADRRGAESGAVGAMEASVLGFVDCCLLNQN